MKTLRLILYGIGLTVMITGVIQLRAEQKTQTSYPYCDAINGACNGCKWFLDPCIPERVGNWISYLVTDPETELTITCGNYCHG